MQSKTKIFVSISILIILIGLGFVWFGLQSFSLSTPSPTPAPIVAQTLSENSKEISTSATQGIEGEKALVTKVVDGDTIEISTGQTVRLVGIDTPETVDPRRPVGCFGKEASNEAKGLLSGKLVILQKDTSDQDKFGRLLRLIYLPLEDGSILFINDYLVREGFAKVFTYPPDLKFNRQFLEAQNEAQRNKKGLWGRC